MKGFKGFKFTNKKAPPAASARTAQPNVEMITSFDGTSAASTSESKKEKLVIHQSEEFLKSKPRQLLEARNKELSKPSSEDPLKAQAVQELINEATSNVSKDQQNVLCLPVAVSPDKVALEGAAEPTLDDYEKVKIEDFGLGLLRGMGWKDPDGETKKADDVVINVRARGLGLGADKLIQKPIVAKHSSGVELQIKRNAKVKILAGAQKDNFGIIEGFEGCNRVTVKLALSGTRVSVNESIITPVTDSEYSKCAKVLNYAKYDSFFTASSSNGSREESKSHSSSSDRHDRHGEASSSSSSSSKRRRD